MISQTDPARRTRQALVIVVAGYRILRAVATSPRKSTVGALAVKKPPVMAHMRLLVVSLVRSISPLPSLSRPFPSPAGSEGRMERGICLAVLFVLK